MQTKRLFLSVAIGAVGGVAAYFLQKKLSGGSGADQSASGSTFDRVAAKADLSVPAHARDGVYSFISGFQDARTVDFCFSYDADRFSYSVLEDSFPVESGDSHVGFLEGEAFSVQFEYGTYYNGEDFGKLRQELSAKHTDLSEAGYASLSGVRFRDGDNLCLAFPIPEDEHSYLLVTMIKAPDNDDELEVLPDSPDFSALMGTARFERN